MLRNKAGKFYGNTIISRCSVLKALHWSAFFIGLLFVFVFSIARVQAAEKVTVAHVIDGDTVVLEDGRKIRLIGINAPEQESDDRPAQLFSLEAKLAVQEMVENREVNLSIGEDEFDRYGRTLGYLTTLDGRDIHAELLAKGYAAVVAFPPNLRNLESYIAIESAARKNNLGIWATPETIQNLSKEDELETGFSVVSGYVTETRESRKNKHLVLNDKLFLLISHDRWKQFWGDQSPGIFKGKKIEARGWIVEKGRFKWMVIQHPSMIVDQ